MKKMIFTLMMIAGLALLANTAMAENEKTVYTGGTYTYRLGGVGSTNAATASVSNPTTVVTNITSGSTIAAGATGQDVVFTATFNDGSTNTPEGTVTFTVRIDDDDTNCYNSIEYDVAVIVPTLVIQISNPTGGGCQVIGLPDDNVDAATNGGPHSNTITFDVVRESGVDLGIVASYSGYILNILESTGALDGDLIAAGDEGNTSSITSLPYTHNITFNTTEGGGSTVTAELVNGSLGTFTLNEANGGGTYDITISTANASDDVTINPLPTIGGF